MSAFAAVLALGAAAAWITAKGARPASRLYLRFACVLYAALAASALANIAQEAVAEIATTLATALLMLAAFANFRRVPKPLPAAIILAAASVAGIWSAASGAIAPSVFAQVICQFVMIALARRGLGRRPSVHLALAAAALLAASCSLLANDPHAFMALLLFSAAGLLGTTLSLVRASEIPLEERRDADGAAAVRRMR
ncbi:MAG: hypothetical protein ABSD21_01310 [Rhizomicrobium sp.]